MDGFTKFLIHFGMADPPRRGDTRPRIETGYECCEYMKVVPAPSGPGCEYSVCRNCNMWYTNGRPWKRMSQEEIRKEKGIK